MNTNRNHKRINTLLSLFLLAALLAAPAPVSGRGEASNPAGETAAPTAAAPNAPVVLGGQVTLQATDFARAVDKPLLSTSPFTVEQIKAVAGSRLTKVGNLFFIINKKKQAVPIEKYVAQLNQYESFLNKYGLTLRDGALALPVASSLRVNPNLGTILKLKPKARPGSQFDEKAFRKQIFRDPTIYERSARVTNPGAPVTNSVPHATSKPGQLGPITNTSGQVPNPARPRAFTEIRLPQSSAGSGQRVQEYKSLCPCAAGCGGSMVDDKKGSKTEGVCPIPPCQNMDNGGGGATTNMKTSTGIFCGEKNPKKNCNPLCLYQGIVGSEWKGLSYCTNTGGGNGWFDAGICMDLNVSMCGGVGGNLNIRNAASMHMNVTLFGLSFDLLDAVAESRYKSKQTVSDGSSKVTIFGSGVELPKLDFSQSFSGPQITILVGPVPITIKSGLNAKLSLGKMEFPFTPPPLDCSAGEGRVGMRIGADGYADIWASASIDAYVAEAGIEAKLILADDDFGVGMSTSINPSQNTIRVEPEFDYRLTHLAGKISLFVEVDLLVYSKRWAVDIFNFPGLNTGNKTIPLDKKEFAAVLPSIS